MADQEKKEEEANGFMLEVDLATEDSAGSMVCGEEDYDDEEEEDEDEEEANDNYDEDEANYDLPVTAAAAPRQTETPYHSSLRKGGTSSAAARYAAASGKRRLSQPVLYTQKTTPTFSYLAYRRSSEGSNQAVNSNDNDVDENDRSRMSTGYKQDGADWSADASALSHTFVPTQGFGEGCYLNNNNKCKGQFGEKLKCIACRIMVHQGCVQDLNKDFICRQTFRESVRKYREQTAVQHHWVERKTLKGKCKHCGSSFGITGSTGFSCSWCKHNYHNKDSCLRAMQNDKECKLGQHNKIIVPPSWIVKVPTSQSFKSSLKASPLKAKNGKTFKMVENNTDENSNQSDDKPKNSIKDFFCVKPIPETSVTPILVFLNPKSGGNQGVKLMQKFQWLLNPRQVFDLTKGGPGPAIELFRKTPGIKLLACGGDGTVGWVLSVLDKIPIDPAPPVGVLPLGTGNDLARSLGWGGGYTDEPIPRILSALNKSATCLMDRWILRVERNADLPASEEKGRDDLPLNVVNNYFSFGVDACIALEFHEAREANPQKFNSRIRNKIYYGQSGAKDALMPKWSKLSEYVTLECDGVDFTPQLKKHKVHSVLFANIPSFGAGTRPWNNGKGEQRMDDGRIEVMGLTTYTLPRLQAGMTATCLTQCTRAKIVTTKTIPMQVDGEASRLNPATIELSFLNQVNMMVKTKGTIKSRGTNPGQDLSLHVFRVRMSDYAMYNTNKDKLKRSSRPFGDLKTTTGADLENVRCLVNKLMENNRMGDRDWCFVDSVTALRFFRIDKAQENLHYVLDICDETGLYILDEDDTSEGPMGGGFGGGFQQNAGGKFETKNLQTSNEIVQRGKQGPVEKTNAVAITTMVEKTTEGILKAARLGDLKMLSELHREGYSLLSIDETGKTALHYGARFGHKDIVKFLISHAESSILDIVDSEKGQSALHKAAAYKRRTICCLLISAGASLLLNDYAGLSPRQLALMAEDSELAAYLESQEQFQAEKFAGGDPITSGEFETPV